MKMSGLNWCANCRSWSGSAGATFLSIACLCLTTTTNQATDANGPRIHPKLLLLHPTLGNSLIYEANSYVYSISLSFDACDGPDDQLRGQDQSAGFAGGAGPDA